MGILFRDRGVIYRSDGRSLSTEWTACCHALCEIAKDFEQLCMQTMAYMGLGMCSHKVPTVIAAESVGMQSSPPESKTLHTEMPPEPVFLNMWLLAESQSPRRRPNRWRHCRLPSALTCSAEPRTWIQQRCQIAALSHIYFCIYLRGSFALFALFTLQCPAFCSAISQAKGPQTSEHSPWLQRPQNACIWQELFCMRCHRQGNSETSMLQNLQIWLCCPSNCLVSARFACANWMHVRFLFFIPTE